MHGQVVDNVHIGHRILHAYTCSLPAYSCYEYYLLSLACRIIIMQVGYSWMDRDIVHGYGSAEQ